MINFFKQIFTWWHSQTIGTFIYTLFTGKLAGKDEFGNKKTTDDIASHFNPQQVKSINSIRTNNHIANAKNKLIEKKCDLIVVNKISKKNNIFGSDYNKVTMISHNEIKILKKMTKINVAKILVNKIINHFHIR